MSMKHEYVAVTDWDAPRMFICAQCKKPHPGRVMIVHVAGGRGTELCSWRCAELDYADRQNMEVDG